MNHYSTDSYSNTEQQLLQDIPGKIFLLYANNVVMFIFLNLINAHLKEYGSAFVCGKSRFEEGKFHVRDDPILQISCGDEHTGVVTGAY